jgi:anti-sigma factor RsiW
MEHPTDDSLLKSVLQLLDEQEESDLKHHLAQCAECRARFERLQRETDIIGSIEPETGQQTFPLPRVKNITYITFLKAAALLVIGFMAGYGTSHLSSPECINVVGHQLTTSAPSESISRYAVCESVDMAVNFDLQSMPQHKDSLDT